MKTKVFKKTHDKIKELYDKINAIKNKMTFMKDLLTDLIHSDPNHRQVEKAFSREYYEK